MSDDTFVQFCPSEPRPSRRRVWLPAMLFLVTCVTTFVAGCYEWVPAFMGQKATFYLVANNWPTGMVFSACVMALLLAHEMGHFLTAVHYRIPASFPYFIPLPLTHLGTMGAVIGMEGSRANRRELFDIGLAGPLAGLVLTVPLVVAGVLTADVVRNGHNPFGQPLLAQMIVQTLRPEVPDGFVLNLQNPLYMAGWIGMLITGINMLPVSQLDGGHVAFALFGRYARLLARGFVIAAIAYITIAEQYGWSLMLVLVILIGADHPPTADDRARIGPFRTILGLLSLAIPILCFTPVPFDFLFKG